jgi:CspA family cold shock protein
MSGFPIRRNIHMPIGTVKFFNEAKGYGFIQPDTGESDAFVHISALERAGLQTLRQDQRGKTSAVNLKLEEQATPGA